MLRSKTLNMSTGNPLGLLIRFSIPMLIGNIFQQAYNLADSIIVGRLIGASALAAVGATGSVTFLFFSVCAGIGGGAGIVTSQYFGADQTEKVKKSITNSAYIMLITSLIMCTAAYLAAPVILRFMRTPEDILPSAIIYMRMNCLGVPLVAIYNYSSSMLRALGDSRTPLIFLIVACFLNVLMDLFCVGVLHMGVFGAALATVLAQMISGISCLIFAFRTNPYFKLERSHFAFDKEISASAVRLGLPLALQWSLIAVSTTALQSFVNSFGTTAVAAFTATTRLEQLIQMPYGSLGQALSTYSGQNYGAGRIERIRAGFRDSLAAVAVFSLAMLVVMQIFGRSFIGAFVKDADVIALGGSALKLTSFFYFFLGVIYITRGILNGVGDVVFSFINGIIEMVGRIGLPFIMTAIPGVGVWGIWWTAGLTWTLSALFCVMRYLTWWKKQKRGA